MGNKKHSGSSLKWIGISAASSLAASIFQVAFVRVMSYSFPFQMIFAISLISGISLFFWGAGAACSRWTGKYLTHFLLLISFVMPGVLIILSYLGLKNIYGGLIPFLIAIVLSAIPFFIFGMIGGVCYEKQQEQDKNRIPLLIAAGSVAFFTGFAGSSYALVTAGVWNLVFISSFVTFFTAMGLSSFIILVPVLSVLVMLFNPGELVFGQFEKKPVFWFAEGRSHKWVGGGWSPYARVDFYDTGGGRLAGLYNGVQYWITGKPEHDVRLRRELYKEITGSVVVIGSGGGHGLISLVNAEHIEAVELDPEVIRFMKGPLSEYNDNIYNRIARAHAGDGRAFMENSGILYDNIVLEAAEVALSNHPRSFISFENHLYTVEAMKLYVSKLKENGVLYVIHTESHVPTEKFLKAMPDGMNFKLLRVPITIPGNEKAKFVTSVTVASKSTEKLEDIYENLKQAKVGTEDITEKFKDSEKFINATPITDNSPALHYKSIGQIIPFFAGAIFFLIVAIGGILKSKQKLLGTFFVFTGAAFMINQLFIINILRSGMGGYMETAALSLGFLTVGASLGAVYSPRIKVNKAFWGVLFFSVFSVAILANFPFHFGFLLKFILIFTAVFPASFFTGVLYPKGMALISKGRISLYLAIDTAASASGFLFFYIMVTLSGFAQTAIIAAVLYVTAAGLLVKIKG